MQFDNSGGSAVEDVGLQGLYFQTVKVDSETSGWLANESL